MRRAVSKRFGLVSPSKPPLQWVEEARRQAAARQIEGAVQRREVETNTISVDPECADPISAHTMCQVLTGTNSEVQAKLERAIKALNIEEQGHGEIATVSQDESEHMLGLRQSVWDLYFCAKQTNPPCDPKHSATVMDARNQAISHLTALQADDGTAKSVTRQTYLNALATMGVSAPGS
jgi:hypothetical protein